MKHVFSYFIGYSTVQEKLVGRYGDGVGDDNDNDSKNCVELRNYNNKNLMTSFIIHFNRIVTKVYNGSFCCIMYRHLPTELCCVCTKQKDSLFGKKNIQKSSLTVSRLLFFFWLQFIIEKLYSPPHTLSSPSSSRN